MIKAGVSLFFISVFSVLSGTSIAAADTDELFTGSVYLAGTNRSELLFLQTNTVGQKNGRTEMVHTYRRVDGSLATSETVILGSGGLESYMVEFDGSDCGCRLDRTGSKVDFSFTRGDTSRRGRRDYEMDLATGPTLRALLYAEWDRLRAGERVYFHFPAMPLQRIVRFQLSRHDKSPFARTGTVVVKMDIANMFIRLFVDPVDLVLDGASGQLLEIHGKSLLERVVDGKKENPVVEIYYTYEE